MDGSPKALVSNAARRKEALPDGWCLIGSAQIEGQQPGRRSSLFTSPALHCIARPRLRARPEASRGFACPGSLSFASSVRPRDSGSTAGTWEPGVSGKIA